ncbi:hypothetical protein JYT26_02970 [Beggiatoa alba]|nr:hypothetical protein [Beggiatoa alba]
MTLLNLDDLKPEMVLCADAQHHTGRILLKAGVMLTAKHLKMFRAWGLSEADVEGDDITLCDDPVELDPARLAEAEARTRERFRHTELSQPAIAELFRLVILQQAQQNSAKQHP